MLTVNPCWPSPTEVPFTDLGDPVEGLELTLWAVNHAQTCQICKKRDEEASWI